MASEKQIAANRRNATKSTGPRTASAKKRTSRNALRHGLTLPLSGADHARQLETLARQIAGDAEDQTIIELARDAARAQLELTRVRRIGVAWFDRVTEFGRFDVPKLFRSPKDEAAWIMQHYFGTTLWEGGPKFAVDNFSPMPKREPERSAEAMRRILPNLLRLQRYELRAAAQRDRAIDSMALLRKAK